jgi:hypothetical protein
MHKSATKCNETLSKWCKNKHGASKIMDMFETYHMSKGQNLLLKKVVYVTFLFVVRRFFLVIYISAATFSTMVIRSFGLLATLTRLSGLFSHDVGGGSLPIVG